jgi:hypothetical protein
MSTLTIDVTDLSVSKLSTINIAVINQPNPVTGYTANADEVYQLINIPKYRILVSGTNTPVTGENYYTYFPEKNPGGGGGGGGGGGDGYTKAETDTLLSGKADKQNAVYNVSYDRVNGVINQITGSDSSTPVVLVDSTPEIDSTNLITSGAAAAAVANLQEQIDNIQPSSGGTFSTSNVQAVSNGFEGSSIGIAEQVTE